MELSFRKTSLTSGPLWAILILSLYFISSSALAVPAGWNIFWSDEFSQADNSGPNGATWGFDTGCSGWGNAELENYTNSTNNSYVTSDAAASDGKCLVIKAINTGGGTCGYTSARILTSGKQTFQYGWIEARMKIPYGQGIWPAFWMLGTDIGTAGWPGCGEIDIMENIGNAADQGKCHGTIHGPGYSGGNGISAIYTLPGGALFKDGYHTFAVNWQVNQLDFYVDDVLYASRTPASLPAGTTWVYNAPFFLLLNLAVGGGWPGNPDGTTVFPQEYRIDYIRVYHQGTPVPTFTPTNTPTPVVASTWRVNGGGPSYTDGAGNLWSADSNFSGGTPATVASAINGTTDDALYQTERYGNPFTYSFNVPSGSYQVTLKFAETYSGITAAGQRVFNVSINGTQVLTNLDIFSEVGSNTADDKVFNNISPSGGTITIQLGPSSADNAKVSAIQIIPMPMTPTHTPSPSATASSTSTRTSTRTWTASSSPTPTNTMSFTNTASGTPTPTRTGTSTPTATFSVTSTNTATSTFSFTSTSSSTATLTRTSTPTSSNTSVPPTATRTFTFSSTPTFTSTATSTYSPVFTGTATPTSTRTTTSSGTPTATTPASTVTSTPIDTLTPSFTPSNTFTVSSTSSSTATRTFTPSFTATSTNSLTQTPMNTVTLTPSATATRTNSATGTSTMTLSQTPSATQTGTSSFTRTHTPTPTFTPTFTSTSTNTSTLSLTPTRTSTLPGTPTATWTATPTWTFTSTSTRTWTATSTATASLTSTSTSLPAPVLYPDPWDGGSPLSLGVSLPPGSEVRIVLWTAAFRKVWSEQVMVPGLGNDRLVLNLPKLANGLYYLRVETEGRRWTLKLLVLR